VVKKDGGKQKGAFLSRAWVRYRPRKGSFSTSIGREKDLKKKRAKQKGRGSAPLASLAAGEKKDAQSFLKQKKKGWGKSLLSTRL